MISKFTIVKQCSVIWHESFDLENGAFLNWVLIMSVKLEASRSQTSFSLYLSNSVWTWHIHKWHFHWQYIYASSKNFNVSVEHLKISKRPLKENTYASILPKWFPKWTVRGLKGALKNDVKLVELFFHENVTRLKRWKRNIAR